MKNILQALAICLLASAARADVLSYSYEVDVDVLAGETVPWSPPPFDESLGELVDVRIVVENIRVEADTLLSNDGNGWIVWPYDPITCLAVIPWLTSEGNLWSAPSWSTTINDPPPCGGVRPLLPPHSHRVFERRWDTHAPYYCGGVWITPPETSYSLLGWYNPDPEWWSEWHVLSWAPTCIVSARLRYAPWPGRVRPLRFAITLTYRLEYEYEVPPRR